MLVTAAHAQSASENGAPADTGTHTETGAGHGSEPHFPPFNAHYFPSQILWLAIVFALFYQFMAKTVVPRIGGILENRRDRIAQDLDEANRLKEETDEAIAAYEQELADARSKAHEISRQAHEKAKAEAEAEQAKVEEELSEKADAAEAEIERVKTEALGHVGSIAEETAAAIVEQLLGKAPSENEVATAVEAERMRQIEGA
ncbi:F0F1 ATP synthase subunit B [Pararhizobium mangrovi]|uniref:ATP synthase subunit b n=1 Tax=Pararhizobium mangrovi TaxID=2590452 RepID=A0A506U030_9HYPH|nr:F0F1 ATP synthase subunit B [Pararhizobium mangrovi]TPW25939.1 F0F1 ATP synthase subunit B [Pararhizobium mangrovi]